MIHYNKMTPEEQDRKTLDEVILTCVKQNYKPGTNGHIMMKDTDKCVRAFMDSVFIHRESYYKSQTPVTVIKND